MDIKNTIQYYISVYSGSEKRVIEKTMNDQGCKRETVESNIDWLIRYQYIEYVEFCNMTDMEKTYYRSDSCRILREIRKYDEIEYCEEKNKKAEEIEKLSNKEKFIIFFNKMETEFNRKHLKNGKNYSLRMTDNCVVITINDDSNSREIEIDFENTSNWEYDESQNFIFYKEDSNYFRIFMDYLWGKSCLIHSMYY